jgi:nicotinate-nucleotide adenylyltransferase
MSASLRLGVFGGTFDPIHLGHLILAEFVRDSLRLDQVLFVPAAVPPHKRDVSIASAKHRCEMIRRAIADHPSFSMDTLELERHGPSYTVETLRELSQRLPSRELYLIMGSDSLADFPYWREPAEIARRAWLAVVGRPGTESLRDGLPSEFRERVRWVDSPLIDISSTQIRQRVSEDRSIRYLVPKPVDEYIQQQNLYRTGSNRSHNLE